MKIAKEVAAAMPTRKTIVQAVKFVALVGSWLVLAFVALNQTLELGMARGDLKHDGFRIRFFNRLAQVACVKREQFEAVAAEEGWRSERRQAPYNDSLLDDGIPTALLMYFEPPIPFAVVDWVAYQFDSSGCLAD